MYTLRSVTWIPPSLNWLLLRILLWWLWIRWFHFDLIFIWNFSWKIFSNRTMIFIGLNLYSLDLRLFYEILIDFRMINLFWLLKLSFILNYNIFHALTFFGLRFFRKYWCWSLYGGIHWIWLIYSNICFSKLWEISLLLYRFYQWWFSHMLRTLIKFSRWLLRLKV